MTTTAEDIRLFFQLPDSWIVEDPSLATDAAPKRPYLADLKVFHTPWRRPHAIATLLGLLTRDADEVDLVVTASVVVFAVDLSDVSELSPAVSRGLERGVECAPGITADFFHMVSIIRDEEVAHAAVFDFTTPNLTLVDELSETFEAIAQTARFAPGASDQTEFARSATS